MQRTPVLVSLLGFGVFAAVSVFAGPRELFVKDELRFINFAEPAPSVDVTENARTGLKDHFLRLHNRTLAVIVRLEDIARRTEETIALAEVTKDVDRERVKLAHARTQLGVARTGLTATRAEFERLLQEDAHTTVRSRLKQVRVRFAREVESPIRNAHSVLFSITLTLKDSL